LSVKYQGHTYATLDAALTAEALEHRRQELAKYSGKHETVAKPVNRPAKTRKAMNKTETAYFQILEARRRSGEFDRVTRDFPNRFPLSNGHFFSPDFCCWRGNAIVEAHEVKGGFARATGKQRDSRILFDDARCDWPGIKWVWIEKEKGERPSSGKI
jgi:hypothetical protein